MTETVVGLPADDTGEIFDFDALVARGLAARLDVGRAVRDGWALFRRHPTAFVFYGLLANALLLVPVAARRAFDDGDDGTEGDAIAGDVVALLYLVALYPVRFGFAAGGLAAARGRFSFGAFFDPFHSYLPLLAVELLATVGILFGYVLCIVPGLYLTVTLAFAPLTCLEFSAHINPLDVLLATRRIAHHSFWQIVLLWLASLGILILGLLCCGVGLLVAVPVVGLVWVAAYDQMIGLNPSRTLSHACGC